MKMSVGEIIVAVAVLSGLAGAALQLLMYGELEGFCCSLL